MTLLIEGPSGAFTGVVGQEPSASGIALLMDRPNNNIDSKAALDQLDRAFHCDGHTEIERTGI